MAAAEFLVLSQGRPDFIEVVAGDKPAPASLGARYLDLDGVQWIGNGTDWVHVTTATFGGTIGTVVQGNAGSASWKVTDTRATTPYFQAAGDETVRNIKATAGHLFALEVSNPDDADYYLQLFDLAAADVVLGTTVPKQSFLVSSGDGSGLSGGMDKAWTVPLDFGTAISYAITTTATGLTGPSTSCVVNAQYI